MPDEADDFPRDHIFQVSSFGDETMDVHFHPASGRGSFQFDYRGFIDTSRKDIAHDPELHESCDVEVLEGAGLVYRVRPRAGTIHELKRKLDELHGSRVDKSHEFDVPGHEEAFLLEHNIRLFGGLSYEQLRTAKLHFLVGWESQSTRRWDTSSETVLVCCAASCGSEEVVLQGTALEIAQGLYDALDRWSPQIIVGHDLATNLRRINTVLEQAYRNPLPFVDRGSRMMGGAYTLVDLAGLCGHFWQNGAPATLSLQELAAEHAIPSSARLSPRVALGLREKPAEAAAVTLEGLRVTSLLAEALLPGAIQLTRELPVTLVSVTSLPPAVLLQSAMRAAYHAANRALPLPKPGVKEKGGGRSKTLEQGRFENVIHLDVTSAYATIISSLQLAPRADDLQALPGLVRGWLDARAQALDRERSARLLGDEVEALRQRSIHRRYKPILLNAYGVLGSERNRFVDHELRARVAAYGRDVINAMIGAVEAHGVQVPVVETDGMYVAVPETCGVSAERLRADVERAANGALRCDSLRVRLAGAPATALIGAQVRVLSNGVQKGFSNQGLSRFAERVRSSIIQSLLTNSDAKHARSLLDAAEQMLNDYRVPAYDVAVPFQVSMPPEQSVTLEGYEHIGWKAAHDAGAVDSDLIWMVREASAMSHVCAFRAVDERSDEVRYDQAWARSCLRLALAPFRALLDGVPGGPNEPGQSKSSPRAPGTGPVSTWLIAGVKREGKIIAREHANYGDRVGEEAFIVAHGDAHALLLGYRGSPDQNAALAGRVRSGDLYIEFEHYSDDSLPLAAAKECIAALARSGVDLARDVHALYGGHRSILVRVRQSALGVPDCVELPMLYERFAEQLDAEIRKGLPDQPSVYDRALYRPDATYRLAGVLHERTGLCATWVTAEKLLAAATLKDLQRTAPEYVPPLERGCGPEVHELKRWFDDATHDLPRSTTHDPRSRTYSSTSTARRQRERAHHRLNVLNEDPLPPCAQRLLDLCERGESVGFPLFAKGVMELRKLGWERKTIARRIASGAGGPSRYGRRITMGPDGPDLVDALWPADIDDSYFLSCTSNAVRAACDFSSCYRSRHPRTFDDENSPSYEEARRRALEVTASITLPEEPGIVAYGAPPRAGKSYKEAQLATSAAVAGEKSVIAAMTHAALAKVGEYIAKQVEEHGDDAQVLAVQLFGRGSNRENCRRLHRNRESCSGCPHDVYVEGALGRTLNPKLLAIRKPVRGFAGHDQIKSLAQGICIRSVSRYLVQDAQIALVTAHHLLHPRWPAMAGGTEFPNVFLDEGDGFADLLAAGDTMTLARSRQALDGPISSPCKMECASCHPDFTNSPSALKWRGTDEVQSVDEHQSPETLFEAMFRSLEQLEADPTLAPHVDLEALRHNLEALSDALPVPAEIRRGHPVSPREYCEAIPEVLSRRPDARYTIEATGDEVRVIFVPLRKCVKRDAPSLHDEEHWYRRQLLHIDGGAVSPALRGLAELTDFLDHGARTAGGVALVPLVKPGKWAKWMIGCSIELRIVDRRRASRLAEYLSSRRSVILTGTLPETSILEALFPGLRVEDRSVPLHRNLTFFMHTIQHSHRSEPFLPRRYEAEHVFDLCVQVAHNSTVLANRTNRPFTVRIFAGSREIHGALLRAARELDLKGVQVVDARKAPVAPHHGPTIEVDYLRSSDTRAVDVDVDLVIILGSGLPNFHGLIGLRTILADAGTSMPLDVIAEDARRRTVVQAALRTAALKGRRVTLFINDMTVADLPRWIQHRVKAAEPLYRGLEGVESSDVAASQRTILAEAIVEALRPQGLPDLEELLNWPSAAADQRRRNANLGRLHAMLQWANRGELIRPGTPKGAKTDWCAMLLWLASRGVLRTVPAGRGLGYAFTESGLAHCLGLSKRAENGQSSQ